MNGWINYSRFLIGLPPRLHYYIVSFLLLTQNKDGSASFAVSQTIIGRDEKNVTSKSIQAARKFSGIGEGAVVTGVSYIGLMTKEQFETNN